MGIPFGLCDSLSPNRFLLARYLPSLFLSLSAAAAGDLGAAAGTRPAATRYDRLAWRGILATGHEEDDAWDEAVPWRRHHGRSRRVGEVNAGIGVREGAVPSRRFPLRKAGSHRLS